MNLTENQMIAELERLLVVPADDDGHLPTCEIMDATGWSERKVHKAIKAAKRAGRLSVTRVQRESVKGHPVPVSAYKLLEESDNV